VKEIIEKARKEDLSDILQVQKAAFKEVAIMHDHMDMPPMTQTLANIEEDFENGTQFYKACLNGEIIASVRGYCDSDGNCHVGRLVVDPNHQRNGIGTVLMNQIEQDFRTCKSYKIFTSEKSTNVLNFYKRLGYHEVFREMGKGYEIVHLQKMNQL
jgi:ribosomal protein S18 acetylase RimI-like enzyme